MFSGAMLEAPTHADETGDEIARHEVSDDGVNWRPYDPARDSGRVILHQRIEFAPPASEAG